MKSERRQAHVATALEIVVRRTIAAAIKKVTSAVINATAIIVIIKSKK